jgi:hypothetical protein
MKVRSIACSTTYHATNEITKIHGKTSYDYERPIIDNLKMNTPSEIYFSANEDGIMCSMASIDTVTFKDLKRKLLDGHEWPASTKVQFYKDESKSKALAYTTELHECLTDNSLEHPLFVDVITKINSGTLLSSVL